MIFHNIKWQLLIWSRKNTRVQGPQYPSVIWASCLMKTIYSIVASIPVLIYILMFYIFIVPTRKEIWWLNVLRFVRRSTILDSKPELLEKVVKNSQHNGKVYYVNHYSLPVSNLSLIMRNNSSIHIMLPSLLI